MEEFQSLLSLPLETISVLAAGYIGYRIAYVGHDETHQTIDVLFASLVFALIAKLASDRLAVFDAPAIAATGGVVAAIGAAAIWRGFLEEFVRSLLRVARVTSSDRHVTAWHSVRLRRAFAPTWIMVRLKSGRRLMCNDLSRFSCFSDGPCIFGEDGSVALFVTDRSEAGSEEWEEAELQDPAFGTALTYVPASEIEEIRVYTRD
ncbi:hypothetical protein OEZ60_20595 [Defluviimonas sp. WL0024]|uniref:DUF421 domain-containing protein n=1 Tax=Albidovulum salinarum TaxID=2984153 RepID=A0ABT2X905_9RHOB|nr:hypothetical protein [Defluviimonas sp. WL0024]MCU9850388.1 hypothetical protein [Defluviimonas sp. WL0024]